MGDGCNRKNTVAVIRAGNQIQGDIFSEAERVKNFSGEQRFYYEKVMANHFGINPKKKGVSRLDVLKKRTKNASQPEGVMDDRLYARPSEQFSKKFMSAIDGKMKAATPENYAEKVAKPMRTLLAALDKVTVNSKSRADLNKQLAKFGLDADNLYDARDYVKWLADGGPNQKSWASALTKKAGVIAKAQANLNMAWTLGNSSDIIRVYSHYASRKGGLKAILEGTATAIKANPFKRNPQLAKQGIYETQYIDQQGANNDPFTWSITAQKNLTYHIDKAIGSDGKTGVRELLFDSTPWDRPRYDRSPEANLVFGLARFPINEARWHYKTVKQALQGDARAAANYGLYSIAKAAMLGAASLIPAPVYIAMPKEMREEIEAVENKYGTNLLKRVSGAVLQKAGINASIDLTTYTQPGGGQLGARAASLVNTGTSVVKNTVKAGIDGVQGNIPAAGVNAIAAASAFANFTGYKAEVLGLLNSTTITELFETTGKELEREFDSDRYSRNIVKAVFGQRNVKKNEDESNLPELPKLPAIK